MINSTISNIDTYLSHLIQFDQELTSLKHNLYQIDGLSNDYSIEIFEKLPLDVIGKIALVSRKWQRLSDMCPTKFQRKKLLFDELVDGKIFKPGCASEVTQSEWTYLLQC